MKTKFNLSEMPTKKQFRIFVNERLFNGTKISRISTYSKSAIIFTVNLKAESMHFCPSFARIQSVSAFSKRAEIVYTVSNDIHGFGSIISEIDYFRRNPDSAAKRNLTVV